MNQTVEIGDTFVMNFWEPKLSWRKPFTKQGYGRRYVVTASTTALNGNEQLERYSK